MKKIFCILLVLCMVLFAFVSCGKDDSTKGQPNDSVKDEEDSEKTSEAVGESSDNTSSDNTSSDHVIPDTPPGVNISYADTEKRNLNGREIYIIERWFGFGKPTIDFTGEVLYSENDDRTLTNVNVAKKEIIEKIQTDYNCKIKGEIFAEGSTDIVADLKNKIINDIESGTNLYDFFFECPYYYTNLIPEGRLVDIKTIPTINLQSSCWDQNAVKELSICNSLYFALGDINTYDNDGTVTMLFNKDLYKELGYTEDLYQLVKDYKWTFDKLVELSSSFQNIDHSKDGVRNELDDWFLGSETSNLYIHVVAAGEGICKKDTNDEPKLNMSTSRAISALTEAVNFYNSGNVLVADHPEYSDKYGYGGHLYDNTVTYAFLEGRELFYMTNLIKIPYFRQMPDEFGILPVPMYSSSQANYCSAMSVYTYSALMIPRNANADADLGLVIQAFAELSEERLTPEYYEKQLKFSDSKDEESYEMLDIIFDSRHYDLGAVFGQSWGAADTLYKPLDTNIESRFKDQEDTLKGYIEETMSNIRK